MKDDPFSTWGFNRSGKERPNTEWDKFRKTRHIRGQK